MITYFVFSILGPWSSMAISLIFTLLVLVTLIISHLIDLYYFITTDGRYNSVWLYGGKGQTSVSGVYASLPAGDCDTQIAEVPYEPIYGIGLLDSNGDPMVCGGSKMPGQKSCHVYHAANNTWSTGPSLKRKRVGASAACLADGICWVFGGRRCTILFSLLLKSLLSTCI